MRKTGYGREPLANNVGEQGDPLTLLQRSYNNVSSLCFSAVGGVKVEVLGSGHDSYISVRLIYMSV